MTRARYHIRFSKTGPLRWISHRDLLRLWERLFHRIDLKLAMTEGFHPKPRMNFPSALALGTASLDEIVELELAEPLSTEELTQRLCDDQQPGLEILRVTAVPEGWPKAKLKSTTYNLPIPEADRETLLKEIEALRQRDTIQLERKGKTLVFSLSAEIEHLGIEDGVLVFRCTPDQGASLRPTDLIEELKIIHLTDNGQFLTRTRVELENEFESTTSVTGQLTS
ncbi:hypothetical protein Poly24_13620 [Rosistilla carotiformis]|uniref:DUF2344 domain-containing protein n=1 Tax=Rosistilla carotiformis TaxID=2528017 RepID=A0A518JQ42_9BACT|nr:TIGR03936 family radical SAM-associated protein [Rosistilla carotiformis]QDV67661.1 hypothetical protein Poly24_13620 [Rosistilla carotiformis]